MDDLLCGMYSSVEDRVESAAVLAQITSPWISDNHKIHNLDLHVMSMVSALTGKIDSGYYWDFKKHYFGHCIDWPIT